MKTKAFFCPDAFDLSMYGQTTSKESKIVSLEIGSCTPSGSGNDTCTYHTRAAFFGKEIALLFNTKRVDYSGDEPNVQGYTEMLWLPIQSSQPL